MASETPASPEADCHEADALIRACLRGAPPAWPEHDGPQLGDSLVERCAFHGVGPLVYARLGDAPGWPGKTVARLREQAAGAAVWEEHHRDLLTRLLTALAEQGVAALLLKGTALAYACYPDPALRTRSDTDLLIPPAARAEADAVLRRLGFRRGTEVSGELISYQASYEAEDRLGLSHLIDLHWRVNNAEVLAHLFEHAELRARAVPAPALGPAALATCPVDAVLIACMHRQVHSQSPYWVDGTAHFSPDRLIWLYDLHLLAGALRPHEWEELGRRAREKTLGAITGDGLTRAAKVFGTALPPGLAEALAPGRGEEMPRIYLEAGALRRQYLDFRALRGAGPKLRLLRELVFPPAAYMRARYGHVRPHWLPWLYARRAVRGTARRLTARLGSSRAS